ncbi:MAG: histidinol dehydrogenase, partial [Aeromicrobium sp.]
MIRRLDLRRSPEDGADADYVAAVPRAAFDVSHAVEIVKPICEDVRQRGADAVLDAGERFDGVRPTSLAVPAESLAEALTSLDPGVRDGLEESISRLRATCEAELESTL